MEFNEDDDTVNRRFEDVCANYFCTSLQLTTDRAAGHCCSFAWTQRSSVIPVVLSIDYFLCGLSTFGKKMKRIY